MKYIIWLLIPIYFGIAWFFPWEKFQWDSSISISYLYDLAFVVLLTLGFRLFSFRYDFKIKGFVSRVIATVGVAFFSLFLINLFDFEAPFKYVDHLVVQLLILAPLVEELIFRHAFFGVFNKYIRKTNIHLLLNSFLFSISHLPAIWTLPQEFKNFIWVQLVYTFFLGWICAKSRLRSKSVFEPIIVHFIFNLIFYIAVLKGSL